MPQLDVILRAGGMKTIDAVAGRSLMEMIRDGGIDEVMALCGGSCACATCHVYVDPAWAARLPAASEDERELLSGSDYLTATSRLSCQIIFTEAMNGLTVTIAPEE
jgi:2Fe-2S ferredoxin